MSLYRLMNLAYRDAFRKPLLLASLKLPGLRHIFPRPSSITLWNRYEVHILYGWMISPARQTRSTVLSSTHGQTVTQPAKTP